MQAKEFIETPEVVWNINIEDMEPRVANHMRIGILIRVNIHELFSKTPKSYRLDPDDPSGGKNKVGDRVDRAIQYWKDGGRMDPPIIGVHNRRVNFLDGRHRLVAAVQLGEAEAPVIFVPADNFQEAKELLNITKWFIV